MKPSAATSAAEKPASLAETLDHMKIAYALKGSRGDSQPHVAFAVEVRRG